MHMNKRMQKYILFAIICYGQVTRAQSTKIFYNIVDYGATGADTTLDTEAINAAIDAAASKGGGTVYFPPGSYYAYTIRLKSNISLFIDQGATLVAAKEKDGNGFDDPE